MTNRGYRTGRTHPRGPGQKRSLCPNCNKHGLTGWKPNTHGVTAGLSRDCQYCGHCEYKTTAEIAKEKIEEPFLTAFVRVITNA